MCWFVFIYKTLHAYNKLIRNTHLVFTKLDYISECLIMFLEIEMMQKICFGRNTIKLK